MKCLLSEYVYSLCARYNVSLNLIPTFRNIPMISYTIETQVKVCIY